MVCLTLTLLNFIMILQILPAAISEQQSSSAGIITDAGGSQILYSDFVAYLWKHAQRLMPFSPNTLKMAKNASSNVWTPLSVCQSILKALSRVMASFSSFS